VRHLFYFVEVIWKRASSGNETSSTVMYRQLIDRGVNRGVGSLGGYTQMRHLIMEYEGRECYRPSPRTLTHQSLIHTKVYLPIVGISGFNGEGEAHSPPPLDRPRQLLTDPLCLSTHSSAPYRNHKLKLRTLLFILSNRSN
jgi:hypothetical protein